MRTVPTPEPVYAAADVPAIAAHEPPPGPARVEGAVTDCVRNRLRAAGLDPTDEQVAAVGSVIGPARDRLDAALGWDVFPSEGARADAERVVWDHCVLDDRGLYAAVLTALGFDPADGSQWHRLYHA